MGEPHARREFRRILSAIGEDDQLSVRMLRRLRNLSQQSVRKHLCDFLKTSAHDTNGSVESAASPIVITARADSRISLSSTGCCSAHMVKKASDISAVVESDFAVWSIYAAGFPAAWDSALSPLSCHGS